MIQSKLRRKKSQIKEHQQARAKGSKLLERVLKKQSVGNISSKSKRKAKEWPVSANIVAKYIRPSLLRVGQKKLKNHFFLSAPGIQIIKANRHKLSWFLERIKTTREKLD